MTTAYTSLLGLALPVTGELSGTWGDTVNNSITSLLDSAVSGTTTISADADITLTTTTGAANEAREAIILWTAAGTVTRNITAPAQSKTYIVINKSSSTQSIVLRGAGPTTGVTIIKGEAAVCAWNGSDFIKVSNISGAGVFSSITNTGLTSGRVVYSTTGGLETDSANLTFNGTTLGINSIASTGALSLASATSTAINLNIGPTELARLSSNVNGIFTVGTEGSVSGLGSGYATLGAYGANGGGFKINRGTGAGTPSAIFYADSTGTFLGSAENSPLVFSQNNAEQMRINTSGNVGIGTSSPSARLDVRTAALGTALQLTDDTNYGANFIGVSGGLKLAMNGSQTFAIWQDVNTRFLINSSGNVGIGTTSPIRKLTVSSAGAVEFVLQDTSQAANSRNWRIFNTGNTMYFGTLNDAGTAGNDYLTINSSGNVGIGTSSPSQKLDVEGGTRTYGIANFDGATYAALDFKVAGTHKGYIATANAVIGGGSANDLAVDASTGNLILATGDVERMRIDSSGNVIVGSTATIGTGGKLQVTSATDTFYAQSTAATTYAATVFNVTDTAARLTAYQYGSGGSPANVGSVTTNGTTVAYNTSSDYRLKEDIAPMTGALAKVALLKPVTYKWKSNGSDAEGFIAHELAEVCPAAVHGVKDAVNKDGNPEYQGIDVSFLVATLTAAIQEQQALITSLTARITALEST